MATRNTRKTSARRPAAGAAPEVDHPASQAEQLSRTLSESAQQIWLAGLGAFNRAQAEGTRLFEGLVRDGLGLEQQARRVAGVQAEAARRNVESTVETARERASETWDRFEKGFEDRVHRTLVRMGVPDRNDLADLSRRVDALTAELRRHGVAATPKARTRPATRTTAAKSPAKKAAAKKATGVRKSAAKAASPRAPDPARPTRAAATRRTRG
jgi:poly(hydroxyalkanoate) granule-associated protein